MDVDELIDELGYYTGTVFVEVKGRMFEVEAVEEDSQGVYLRVRTTDREMR
jgi:hypothetical protein